MSTLHDATTQKPLIEQLRADRERVEQADREATERKARELRQLLDGQNTRKRQVAEAWSERVFGATHRLPADEWTARDYGRTADFQISTTLTLHLEIDTSGAYTVLSASALKNGRDPHAIRSWEDLVRYAAKYS